jgi:hypothetical protein
METTVEMTGAQVLEEAEKIVAGLNKPDEVQRVAVSIGPDHRGEMSLWFRLLLKPSLAETPQVVDSLRSYSYLLTDKVFENKLPFFPYTSLEASE